MGDEVKLLAMGELAREAIEKGRSLQQIEELKLVGNAYVGMGQRILAILKED